jgi:hypothetical protein
LLPIEYGDRAQGLVRVVVPGRVPERPQLLDLIEREVFGGADIRRCGDRAVRRALTAGWGRDRCGGARRKVRTARDESGVSAIGIIGFGRAQATTANVS